MSEQQVIAGWKTLVFGVGTALLYFALYLFAQDVIQLSAKGGRYWVIPISIAFVFSYVHGVFTANFWEWLGVQAKK